MAHLYILQSEASGRFYVGSSSDLARRWREHERGHSPFTKARGPWKLVYQEQHASLAEARRREREIKSWKSHRAIVQLLAGHEVG